jgi:hypothetical protein
VDVLEPFLWQIPARLAVRTLLVGRQGQALILTPGLGLSDRLTTGSAALGDLPQKGPKDQAQVPAAIPGMRPIILLSQTPVGNPGREEQLEVVQGGAGAGAQFSKLAVKAASPIGEIRRYHGQCIYCPIDSNASLFFVMARKNLQSLPPEYRRLRKKLSNIGWIALGSLVERNKPGQGGPRYQWSRRVGAKTLTVALSAQQFTWLKQAISNQRQVWDLLMELQQITAKFALENITGPPRRKRLSKKQLGLN